MLGGKKPAKSTGLYGEFRAKAQEVKSSSSDVKKGNGGREDICVYSLKHGVGTSYIAASIANYMANHRRGDVSLVLNDTEFSEDIASPKVNTVSWAQEAEVFNKSDYIVHDIGVFGDLSADRRNALQRASMKILLCKADGNFLSKLAAYVESGVVDVSSVVFLFDELPSEWEKKVYDIMDFTNAVYCVPTFYALAPSTQVVKVFNEIFRRK